MQGNEKDKIKIKTQTIEIQYCLKGLYPPVISPLALSFIS